MNRDQPPLPNSFLLRHGTITANPYLSVPLVLRVELLPAIFQYRSGRQFHRWQFWLMPVHRFGSVEVPRYSD